MARQVHTSTPGLQPAVLSGLPAFEQVVSVGRPAVGDRDQLFARLNDALDRRRLTSHGPFAAELETRLGDLLGAPHCILVNSATTGLQIAARALDLQGEIIMPAYARIETAQALAWMGLTPVFSDVDPTTCTLDPRDVERRLTPRTRAILGVHQFGRACAVDDLQTIAQQHDLSLLFDAADAFRCSYRSTPVGSFGRCEVFNFHASMYFNTLEGGAVTTTDEALAARLRSMRDFGFAPSQDRTMGPGTHGAMNELCAVVGLTGLDSLDDVLITNVAHYDRYKARIVEIPGLRLVEMDDRELNNHQYIVIRVDAQKYGMTRDELRAALRVDNIIAGAFCSPACHRMAPFDTTGPSAGVSLPVSERLANDLIALPTGTSVTSQDVERICELLLMTYVHGPAVRHGLARARG